jgi:23S rRNA (cytosine1962-C5)-methyltransferase
MSSMPVVTLGRDRDRSLRRRHPWVFTGAIASRRGDPDLGDTVLVRAANGDELGLGAFSPESQIAVRMWSFDANDAIDAEWFRHRIAAAVGRRRELLTHTNSVRLVHSEADGLPGITIDRFGSVAVMQLASAGGERWRHAIAEALLALDGIDCVVERSDVEARRKEGLDDRVGLVAGSLPDSIEILEDAPTGAAWRFGADPLGGHKTGFYLDQRDARTAIHHLAVGRRVANLFAYTGGFTVAALTGGATSVVSVDSSGPALDGLAANCAANDVEAGDLVRADVFSHLRTWRDAEARFDLVICDPPKLAASARQVDRAARAYKDLNWLSLRLLEPGGILVTFSCSGSVTDELFTKIVAGAALDARRDVEIIGRLGQPSDHPIALAVPESAYLKGLICRVR